MFTSDLNAGVVPQMSPPPHDLERLRTTMVDFIVLSIKLVFMVLGVSYSRLLAQRTTGYCSASASKTGYDIRKYVQELLQPKRRMFLQCSLKNLEAVRDLNDNLVPTLMGPTTHD